MANITVTMDKDLAGPVTIICPQPVTLDESFKILQSVLSVRGFAAVIDGKVMSIVPFDRAVTGATVLSTDPKSTKFDPRNPVMTQVIPLENVDAEAIAKEMAPLITKGASIIGSAGSNALILTDYANNIKRILDLVNALDKTSNATEMEIFHLQHAEAVILAETINNLYKQITTRGRGAGPLPGQPPPQPGQPSAGGGRPAVVAVADIHSNSVIVVASPEILDKIHTTIIGTLDADDSENLSTKPRKIKFADASTIAGLVNNVLTNMHGGSATLSGGQTRNNFGGFFFGGGGGGGSEAPASSSDPFGKVVPDPRTNFVLITATPERMILIDSLLDELDVEVPVETTTFVYKLKHAQANDIAYALGNAFGTYQDPNQNNNFFGGFFGGGGNNNNAGTQRPQPIQRRLGGTNRSASRDHTWGN